MLSFQLLLTIFLVSGSFALYDSSPDVVKLTPDNFEELVTNSNEVWLVKFYAPWCGWSQVVVPEYTKAACALKGIAKVGAIDADNYREFGQLQGILGYPTFRVFTGTNQAPYQGSRTAESFIEAALEAIKDKAIDNLSYGSCVPLVNNFEIFNFPSNEIENMESKICSVY